MHDGHREQRPRKVFVRDEKELSDAAWLSVPLEAAEAGPFVVLDVARLFRVVLEVVLRFLVVFGVVVVGQFVAAQVLTKRELKADLKVTGQAWSSDFLV